MSLRVDVPPDSRALPIGAATLPVFGASGALKASPGMEWLPFDLTLACAVVVALAAADSLLWMLRRREPPSYLGWLLGVVLVACIGLIRPPETDYASAKVTHLFVLTLLVAFGGGLLLVRTERERRWFLWSTIAVGLLVALLVRLFPDPIAEALGRLALAENGTIPPGRIAGAAIVVLLVFALGQLYSPLRVTALLALGAVLTVVLLGTGSRGPLLGVGGGVLAVLLASRGRRGRAVVVTAVGAALAFYMFQRADLQVRTRIALLLAENQGASVNVRWLLWDNAWETWKDHAFLGVGWGGAQGRYSIVFNYPHNLLLEVAAEAGLFAALGLVVVVAVAFRRAFRSAQGHDATALCLVGLLAFWLVNALVSGDVNDNRDLFVVLGAALALRSAEVHGAADLVVVGAVVAESEDVALARGGGERRRRSSGPLDARR